MMPARSMSPQRTYSEMTKGVFFGGTITSGQVIEGVQVVEVIEGTSLPLLDHLDDLDTLDDLRPILRQEKRSQRVRNQRLVCSLPVDQPDGENSDGALRLLHV